MYSGYIKREVIFSWFGNREGEEPTMDYTKIADLVFQYGGFVYGGYVREFLRGEYPSDLDCYIPPKQVLRFLSNFQRIKSCETIEDYGYFGRSAHYRVIGEDYQVDIALTPVVLEWPDFDVNGLMMDRYKIQVLEPWNKASLPEVLQNIAQKRARMHYLCRKERVEKMLSYGWQVVRE